MRNLSEQTGSISSEKVNPRPLSVLVNARPLSTVFTGIARYTRSLYESIEQLNDVHASYFVCGKAQKEMPEQSNGAVSSYFPAWIRSIARRVRLNREDKHLRQHFDRNQVDIYHETGAFPTTTGSDVPKVLTIYDLSLITHKHCHPSDRVDHFERYFYDRLKTVDHIITISDFVREEIIDHLNIPPNKVSTVHLAASSTFNRRSIVSVEHFLKQKRLPSQYILSVGTREPRKNLLGLIRAYERVETELPLICVGWSGWKSDNIKTEIARLKLQDKVMLIGHISDDDLAFLYSGARVMVYPSFYEGFGLPLLEAMACDCPVICSDRSSMPEVAGGAAILINPDDTQNISENISRMINDDTLCQEYSKLGHQRASEFSWDRAAQETLSIFRTVSKQSSL